MSDRDVLVGGAGPVGMMAALSLQRAGLAPVAFAALARAGEPVPGATRRAGVPPTLTGGAGARRAPYDGTDV